MSFIFDARHVSDHTLSKMHIPLELEFRKIINNASSNLSLKPLGLKMEHLLNSKAVNSTKIAFHVLKMHPLTYMIVRTLKKPLAVPAMILVQQIRDAQHL